MRRLVIAVVVALVATLPALPAVGQEVLDPHNCRAQGMQVGGGYECAPLSASVMPPAPSDVAHVYQGGYHWYWYPDSGWYYDPGDGYLYPG
jgi:opacity protein-like surface antigen